MNKRNEIIEKAIIEKLTGGVNIYTADDILTAANITEKEIQDFHAKMKNEIDELVAVVDTVNNAQENHEKVVME